MKHWIVCACCALSFSAKIYEISPYRIVTLMPVCVDELVSIFIDAVELIISLTKVIHEFEFILGYHLENYENYDTCRVQGLL